MAQSIWKYPLRAGAGDDIAIQMPQGARLLTVQMQGAAPWLWALVEPDRPREQRQFQVVGTGWELDWSDAKREYIGTVQAGTFVWHFFEVLQGPF